VLGRFSDAGRLSVSLARQSRRPKTCTQPDIVAPQQSSLQVPQRAAEMICLGSTTDRQKLQRPGGRGPKLSKFPGNVGKRTYVSSARGTNSVSMLRYRDYTIWDAVWERLEAEEARSEPTNPFDDPDVQWRIAELISRAASGREVYPRNEGPTRRP